MGYTTEFNGSFKITPTLSKEHREYLHKFCETRRMERDAALAGKMKDPIREAANLPIGTDGEYFVGAAGFMGQHEDSSVTNSNQAPGLQPGLWCQWEPTECGEEISWNGMEKFYNYTEWLSYMIANFFRRWGYTLNGKASWSGEDADDAGVIYIQNNRVEAVRNINPGPSWRQS